MDGSSAEDPLGNKSRFCNLIKVLDFDNFFELLSCVELIIEEGSQRSENTFREAITLVFNNALSMPSHIPNPRKKAVSKRAPVTKPSRQGRLSAARARVKAELKKGTYQTVAQAVVVIAPDFNVSPGSLRVSMSRNKLRDESESPHHGNSALTKDEEEMLLAFVLAFDTASMPLRNKQILGAIFNGFKKQVSKSWVCLFKTRHSNLLRTTNSKGIETARLKATKPEEVQDWLDRYTSFMEFHSFRGHARFNVDETRLIPPKAHSRVTAAKGQKELNKNNKRETRTNSVGTLVPFISADGAVFMSFYVVKDKKEAEFKQVIPKESKGRGSWPRQYAVTRSGFVDKRLWREIMYAFEREFHRIHPDLDCIVFMDNCAVHRDDLLDLTRSPEQLDFGPCLQGCLGLLPSSEHHGMAPAPG